MFAKRLESISSSLTLAISAKAKKLKADGVDVVGFGAGEPDFDTQDNIKAAAKKAIDDGVTKYAPVPGKLELKKAIKEKMKEDNGLDYEENQIIVGCGAKHVLFETILALVNSGEEVVIPAPYWLSYPEMAKVAGGIPKFIETRQEHNFKVAPEQLQEAISSKTKLFILNSPSNPTGAVYTRAETEALAKVVENNDIFCISDEIYEKLIYESVESISIASLSSSVKEKTIVVNGVSKAYAMTGWRIGFACARKDIVSSMAKVQSHSTSGACSISQAAAVEALRGPQSAVSQMRDTFRQRRDFMVDRVNKIKGLNVLKPEGAFYCFVNISECLNRSFQGDKIENSLDFATKLLDREKVAVVPGKAFGNDAYIRLSYAVSLDNIKKGLERIDNFVKQVQ